MNTISTTKVTEKTSTFIRYILDGVKTLTVQSMESTIEVKTGIHPVTKKSSIIYKKKSDKVIGSVTFNLVEVTPEELAVYRSSGIPYFVLKDSGKLYFTKIQRNYNLVSHEGLLGPNLCSHVGHECHHLSAATDEDGGCAKVRSLSQCIERYPWITKGYETFNTVRDAFVVIDCTHYEKCPPRKERTVAEVNRLRLGLAQIMWDDVESLQEVKRRKAENLSKMYALKESKEGTEG